MADDPRLRGAAIEQAVRTRQLSGGWIVCRGTKVGALTGLVLGAGFGTLAAPVLGTVIGAVVGVVVGVVTGFVDAVALSALGPPVDDRQSAWAASVVAALTAWPVPALLGYAYGLPGALAIAAAVGLSGVIGGVVGPYVVLGNDRPGRRADGEWS